MAIQSKWVIEEGHINQVVRTSTIKPRIDYAADILDAVLDVLVQKRLDLNKSNLELYRDSDGSRESIKSISEKVSCELEISYAIESLRQVRRCFDSIVGMGNVAIMLSPSISIVRVTRSKMLSLMPSLDYKLGELSLLLSGVIVDSAHLAGSSLDFERANCQSRRLLDEAKLIADSKIYNQFPNLDFS